VVLEADASAKGKPIQSPTKTEANAKSTSKGTLIEALD